MIFQQPSQKIKNAYKVEAQSFLRRFTIPGKCMPITNKEPRGRIGSYPTPTLGTNFIGMDLGSHSYGSNLSEKNGIVYTCKAGLVDIAHSRKVVGWTAFLASKTFKKLMENETRFSFK